MRDRRRVGWPGFALVFAFVLAPANASAQIALDHVPVAVRDLDATVRDFASLLLSRS